MKNKFLSSELNAFYEAITGDIKIYSWVYSKDGELIYSNGKSSLLGSIFKKTGCKDYMIEYGKMHRHPLILSADLGIAWCAVFEYKDNEVYRYHVIGPIFNTESSPDDIRKLLQSFEIQFETKESIVKELSSLPSISSMTFFHDCTLFHFFVTGEKITRSDIHFQLASSKSTPVQSSKNTKSEDRKRTYAVERELLKMVRDGNLDYQNALNNATMISSGIRMTSSHSLDQAKISCCSFTSLCTRAAIEGGLSPETAYTVGDNYIQEMYECTRFSDLVAINHAMYDDFIVRVNKKNRSMHYSTQIQTVIDEITYHFEDELSLEELASKVFYSEAYLSRKFKEETGMNIHDYLIETRLKNAAFDLENTNLPIHKIAEKYRFSSSYHFSNCFKKKYDMLPNEYRKEKQR